MILPTTSTAAVVLLLISFLCFGLWINTFKLAGPRWRFELYSIDFAIGFVLLSVIAAFTLGTLGSDLAFNDRLLVAGRASQAFVVAAGFLFNLGNMLFLATVGLLGVSGAFPISIGSALIISSLFSFRSTNTFWLLGGIALILLGVVLDAVACRARESAQKRTPAATAKPVAEASAAATKPAVRVAPKPVRRKARKGIFIGILSGVMLGFFYPIASRGMTGELTLGPYAGLLMFGVGILFSTLLFDFYFLNIAIEGERLSPGAYLQGQAPQHFLGFAGGALWATGALAALLAFGVPLRAGLPSALKLWAPLASVLLAVVCGALGWKEFKAARSSAKLLFAVAIILFTGGLALIGFGINI